MLYALLLIQVATLIVVRTLDPPQRQHHHLFTYGRTFHFAQPDQRTQAQLVPKYGNFSSTALALRYRPLPLPLPLPEALPLPSLKRQASSQARPYHFGFHLRPATSSIRRQLIVSPQPSVLYLPRLRSNTKAVLLKTTTATVHRQPVIAVAAPSTSKIIVSSSSSPFLPYRNISSSKQLYVPSRENVDIQRTAPDISAGFFSKALENVVRFLPPMRIGNRQNPGCVGGTKCQFFAVCWMSGGSLGASCGPLYTCCVTPSSQDIQPQYWGPVINDPQCGKSATRISRIVGGSDASFGQFPWQAFVQVGGSRCGGALVGPAHVVTAGHCVARSQHNPSSIRVTLGDYILHSEIESLPHEVFTVSEVKLHPNFRFTPQADRYDVAVLVLDRSVQYRENIMPICLPPKGTIYLGRMAYVAGWGALQAGSKLRPKVLQHVPVPVIENPICEGWHKQRGINIKIYDEMMCAGYESGGKDACQGDSGGPLMLNEFGVWYLIGIVSAGYSCAKQYQPGIYHRVSSSSDWVSSNVFPSAHFRTPP